MQPGVELTNLTIRGHDGKVALSVPHATAALSWMSLLRLSPALSSLIVDQPDLVVARAADGSPEHRGRRRGDHPRRQRYVRHVAAETGKRSCCAAARCAGATRSMTRRKLVLSGIRLAVLNAGRVHKAALQAPANGTLLLGPLDFRARFSTNRSRRSASRRTGRATRTCRQAGRPADAGALPRHAAHDPRRPDRQRDLGHLRRRPPAFGGRRPAGADVALRVRPAAAARRADGRLRLGHAARRRPRLHAAPDALQRGNASRRCRTARRSPARSRCRR